eukprot:364682-Chlamydomonas_euryale.AAC.20
MGRHFQPRQAGRAIKAVWDDINSCPAILHDSIGNFSNADGMKESVRSAPYASAPCIPVHTDMDIAINMSKPTQINFGFGSVFCTGMVLEYGT